MVRPERRTRADVVAAALIAVAVIAAGLLIWWTSDARATSSRPVTAPGPESAPAQGVPATVAELWSATSPATSEPVLISTSTDTVVTGDGHEMAGRDPATGKTRWTYARGADLCAVSWIYRYAVAVFPDGRGCGQVSTVDAATGRRGPARTSYADSHVTVTSDSTAVLSAGPTRLELWRSDMVRVLSYGEIDAPLKPSGRRVGSGCTLVSAAAGSSAVSVLEACPGQDDLRLALLRPGKEEDEPEQRNVPEPGVTADSGARVLAVSDAGSSTHTLATPVTLVYLPSPQPRVEVIDQAGAVVATTPLPGRASPASAHVPVSRPAGLLSWWTGDAVLMFDATTLSYRYAVPAAGPVVPLGPAATMAGRLLIPVSDGIGVYHPGTGHHERTIAVRRPVGVAAVFPGVSGATILEQRDDTLAALG